MKNKLFVAFFLLSFVNIILGQEPPVFFAIELDSSKYDLKQFTKEYKFGSIRHTKSVVDSKIKKYLRGERIKYEEKIVPLIEDKNYYFVANKYVYEFVSFSVKKGNIISLHIVEKKTEQHMNIYVRVNKNLDEGDVVLISDFCFTSGNYFFDFCTSEKKYEVKDLKNKIIESNYDIKYKVDLNCIQKHKIRIKKINKIFTKTNKK